MRHRSLLAGAMVGLWSWHGLTSAEAVACSPILPRPVLTDPALEGSETTPPTLVFVEVYNLQRGYSPADTTSSCADMAWLELLPYGEDDQTASSDLRYRVEYVSGFKPMSIDPEPLEYLSFPWADPKPSLQQSLNLTLRIFAVDLAGNESEPFELFVGEESATEGCTVGGTSSSGGAAGHCGAIALMGIIAAAQIRRRRASGVVLLRRFRSVA